MMIILEGPDGAGKTTLAKQLTDEILKQYPGDQRVRIMHKGPPTENAILEYVRPLADYRVSNFHEHIICDRWHVGEAVYPAIFNRESRMSNIERRYIEMFLESRGALLVRVTADAEVLMSRLGGRGEDTGIFKPVRADELFAAECRQTWYPFFHTAISREDGVSESARIAIVSMARAAQELQDKYLGKWPNYVGPSDPQWLLVGDIRGNLQPDIPTALAPLERTAGDYLFKAIDPVIRNRMGIINANEPDPTWTVYGGPRHQDVEALWESIGRPRVVTMGQLAHATIKKTKIADSNFGAVPHPQYVRRFHYQHAAEYATLIQSALLYGGDHRTWRP